MEYVIVYTQYNEDEERFVVEEPVYRKPSPKYIKAALFLIKLLKYLIWKIKKHQSTNNVVRIL